MCLPKAHINSPLGVLHASLGRAGTMSPGAVTLPSPTSPSPSLSLSSSLQYSHRLTPNPTIQMELRDMRKNVLKLAGVDLGQQAVRRHSSSHLAPVNTICCSRVPMTCIDYEAGKAQLEGLQLLVTALRCHGPPGWSGTLSRPRRHGGEPRSCRGGCSA